MEYIYGVTAMQGYRLHMQMVTGSEVIVDLSSKICTMRFADLKDQAVFNNVKTDGNNVIWGNGILKIPVCDLVDVALTGM